MRGVVLFEVRNGRAGPPAVRGGGRFTRGSNSRRWHTASQGATTNRPCYRWAGGRAGVRCVGADLVNLQKIVSIVPTSKDTLFPLRIGDDLLHGFAESNDSDDLDVTEVLMGKVYWPAVNCNPVPVIEWIGHIYSSGGKCD